MRSERPSAPRWSRILFLALTLLIFACNEKVRPCREAEQGLSDAERIAARGYCFLEKGDHREAAEAFAEAIRADPSHPSANFGAAFTDLLILISELYTQLWSLSFKQDESFHQFQAWLVADALGGSPEAVGRLDRDLSSLRTAAEKTDFRVNIRGFALRVNLLETYHSSIEVDSGDAHALAAVFNVLKAAFSVLAAYDLDIPVSYMLNPGEPIYSLLKLDVDAAMNDSRYPRFLALRPDATGWMGVARGALVAAADEYSASVAATMKETDNQSTPDLEDYPDLVSRPYFTLDGTVFIPGIFGPAPTTAILQMLFQQDRKDLIATLNRLFPGSPAELPDALEYLMQEFRASLLGARPFRIAGVELPLHSFFENPVPLRTLLQLLEALQPVTPGASQPIPWVSGALANRADPSALPWEHPEKYEPVPTPVTLEAQRLRGVDGPAAEIHVGNGEVMAGITREGRLKNLFFPSTTSYNLVPYITRVTHPYLETEPLRYMGANPEHGSFPGLRINGALTWPMNWLDHRHVDPGDSKGRRVRPVYEEPGVPVARISYRAPEGGITIEETSYVPRLSETDRPTVLVRRFAVHNDSATPLPVSFLYYGAFNVTNIDQYILGPKFWVAWLFSENDLTAGADGSLTWTGPGWSGHPKGGSTALIMTSDATRPLLRGSVGQLTPEGDLGAWNDAYAGIDRAATQKGVSFGNGYLEWDLGRIEPGGESVVTILLALGAGPDGTSAEADAKAQIERVLSTGFQPLLDATRRYWKSWLASLKTPEGVMNEKETRMYSTAAMALKLNQAALTGALPELWDMQPMWFMVWPGNGVWHAAALEALGHPEDGKAYLDFLARTQSPDGHWRMAYTALGRYHGAFEIEYYATPSVLWFAWVHWKMTQDDAWLRDYWPTVEKAADFVVARRAMNGLLYASPDFVEDVTAFRQSLFTNSIAVSGLRAASELAEVVGKKDLARRYRAAARELYDALIRVFWNPAEAGFWAFSDMHGLHGRDTPPVFAWPFHAFSLDDPRVLAFAESTIDPAIQKQDFLSFTDSNDWTPGLMKNAVFYFNHFNATGREESKRLAQSIVDGILSDRNLTLGGFIAERYFGYGIKGSGKPLLWPHSMFILAQLSRQGPSPLPLLLPFR